MATTFLLALFVTLAQASLIPPLPPLVVRDGFQNITIMNNISGGHNTTYSGAISTRNYGTAVYKIYIAFMVFGTISAALMLPVIYTPDMIHWWKQKKHQKAVTQRKQDVAEATMRMRQMVQQQDVSQPQRAHVRPGSNWI